MNEDDFIKSGTDRDRFLLHQIAEIRALIERGPSKYRVKLVSIGQLGEAFAEDLIKELGSDPALESLDIWHRIALRYKYDKKGNPTNEVVRDERETSHAGTYKRLLDEMTQESYRVGEKKKHSLEECTTLKDLRQIVEESQENPSVGDIAVLSGRYDFSFTLKNKKTKKVIRPLNPEDENDYKIIENTIMTSVYIENPEEVTREEIIRIMKDIKEERKKIEDIIREVVGDDDHPGKTWEDGQPWLNRNRAENLIDSIIGVRELGKAFEGYRGNVMINVNEVDFTHTAFAKSSKIDPRKIDALADNDEIRYETFIAERINKLLGMDLIDPRFLVVPTWGPHNEYVEVIFDLITYNDEPLYKLIEEKKLDLDKIKKEVGEFGHVLYDMRGSSDKDAADAIKHIVKSIMFKGKRSRRPVRTVVGFPEENYSIGMPVKHDKHGLQEPLHHQRDCMNKAQKDNFERAVTVIKYINDRFVEEGILPKEWEYEEFTPLIPASEGIPLSVVDNILGESGLSTRSEKTKPEKEESAVETEVKASSEPGISVDARFAKQVIVVKGGVANIGSETSECQAQNGKVVIPSDFEVKLYALDQIKTGYEKRIAELDFKSRKPRYFSFDFREIPGADYSDFIRFVADEKNIYALYATESKQSKKEYGLIRWDRKSRDIRKKVSFGDLKPSSLCTLDNEIYVSFENPKETKEPVSIKRLSADGEVLEEYKGAQIVSDVSAGILDDLQIFGVEQKKLHIWKKGLDTRPSKSENLEAYLFSVDFFNDEQDSGQNILACRSNLNNSVVLYDLDARRCVPYDSYKGIYDLVFTDKGIILATARKDDARPIVMAFENINRLFEKKYTLLLDPAKDEPYFGGLLDIRGLNIVDDLLMLYGKDNKVHIVNWKEPFRRVLDYPYQVSLEDAHLLREKNVQD